MHIHAVCNVRQFGQRELWFEVDTYSGIKVFNTIHEALAYIQHEMNMMVAKRYER